MNALRFDTLTRRLTATPTRRTTVAMAFTALVGLTGLVPIWQVAAGVGEFPCSERGSGGRCNRNAQCCSGRCKRKHGKRTGRCRCSHLAQPCAAHDDCCGHVEGDPAAPICSADLAGAVCCKALGAPCGAAAECCGALVCNPGSFCDLPS